MAVGKSGIGFSKPYVALKQSSGYGSPTLLARGVSISGDFDQSSPIVKYADNCQAEVIPGKIKECSLSVTVDGLKEAARKLILGLADSTTVGTYTVQSITDSTSIPYVGFGYVTEHISEGTHTFTATVFPKVMFEVPDISANTAEEDISFTDQELKAHAYADSGVIVKLVEELTSESDAVAAITALLA